MGIGLEIYDKKGRLIIDSESIIPRFLGKFELPLNRYGTLTIPEIKYSSDFNVYRWENDGAGGGQTQTYDSFHHYVIVWAL